MMNRGIWRDVTSTFESTLEQLPPLLAGEGFGLLTQIDVQETLKKKIGVDFRRYRILGACNPKLAHQALSLDLGIGLLLPCNFVVYERDDGGTTVGAIDPLESIGGAARAGFQELAATVRGKLERVVAGLR